MKKKINCIYELCIKKHRCSLQSFALLLLSLMLGAGVSAQTITVKGVVKDDSGETLIGVSVAVSGTTTGTITNYDGEYTVSAPSQGKLVFSFLGYASATVNVNGQTTIDVTLKEDTKLLDEVVVVGYGVMKRSDLTGAVSSVNADAIAKANATSIDQVLQGRVAGVQMTQNSGMPGGGSSIQIRGLNSINATSEPIYIIDGVTISGNTGTMTDNALSSINPSDIESMEILKDASATAIYGAQGANGVIIITTKSGKEGRLSINAEMQYGTQYLSKQLEMMNLREYAQHHNEAMDIYGYDKTAEFADPSLLGKGTNWQTTIFRPAAMQNYSLNIAGGVKGTSYKVSAGYMTQDGIAAGSDFDRITLNTSLDSDVRSWLTVGARASLARTTQTTSIADWNIINSAVRQKPNVPVYNLDGSWGAPGEDDDQNTPTNALAIASLNDKNNRKLSVRGNIYANIKPVSWMSYRTEMASNVGLAETHSFVPSYYFTSWQKQDNAQRQETMEANYYWAWRNQLNFNLKPADGHNVSLMLGHEMTENKRNYLRGERTQGSNSLVDLNAGDVNTSQTYGNTGRSAFLSYFGRAHYSMLDRYMLTGTLRYDGSSNFAKGNQWGAFPSAAVAWRVNQEDFMKDIKDINNLKLRVGYGVVGNSNVASFAYTAMMANVPTVWGNGALIARIPNEKLTWETTKSVNVGLDLNLFNNRIEFIADWYDKRTDDLLIVQTLTGTVGTGGVGRMEPSWANIGSLQNTGVEFTLNTVNITKKDFEWRSNFTISFNRNEVLSLNTATAQQFKSYGGMNVTVTQPGLPIGQFYGYKVIGRINSAADLYDANGNIKVALPEEGTSGVARQINERNGVWVGDFLYEDISGPNGEPDGLINSADQQVIGNPLPDFTGGFGNTFSYKGFDLNAFFTYSYGNDVLNWIGRSISSPRDYHSNLTKQAGVRYAKIGLIDPDGPSDDIYNVRIVSGDSEMPRLSMFDMNENRRLSSLHVEDGSYIRLQTLSLSYNVPRKWLEKLSLETVKLTCNVSNVFTLTKYSGYDPEVGMARDEYSSYAQSPLLNGFDAGRYPTPRTFTFGINVGF